MRPRGPGRGAITGFGSIIIAGIEIETDDDTVFEIEGDETPSQQDLSEGMVVAV